MVFLFPQRGTSLLIESFVYLSVQWLPLSSMYRWMCSLLSFLWVWFTCSGMCDATVLNVLFTSVLHIILSARSNACTRECLLIVAGIRNKTFPLYLNLFHMQNIIPSCFIWKHPRNDWLSNDRNVSHHFAYSTCQRYKLCKPVCILLTHSISKIVMPKVKN